MKKSRNYDAPVYREIHITTPVYFRAQSVGGTPYPVPGGYVRVWWGLGGTAPPGASDVNLSTNAEWATFQHVYNMYQIRGVKMQLHIANVQGGGNQVAVDDIFSAT